MIRNCLLCVLRQCFLLILVLTTVFPFRCNDNTHSNHFMVLSTLDNPNHYININDGSVTGLWLKKEPGYYFISLTPLDKDSATKQCTEMGGCLHVAEDFINNTCFQNLEVQETGFYSCYIKEVCPPNGYIDKSKNVCYFLTRKLTWKESLEECSRLNGKLSDDKTNVLSTTMNGSLWLDSDSSQFKCGTNGPSTDNCSQNRTGVCYRNDDKDECTRYCFWVTNDTDNWQTAYIKCKKSEGQMIQQNTLDKYLNSIGNAAIPSWIDSLTMCPTSNSDDYDTCDEHKKALCERVVHQNEGVLWLPHGQDRFYISKFKQTYDMAKMFCSVAGGALTVSRVIENQLDPQYQYWINDHCSRQYYRSCGNNKWRIKRNAKISQKRHFICKMDKEFSFITPKPTTTTQKTTTTTTPTATPRISNCNNQTGWKLINQMKYYVSDYKMDYNDADDCCNTIGGNLFQFTALDNKMKREFLDEKEQYWIEAEDDEQPYLTYDPDRLMWSRAEEAEAGLTSIKRFICQKDTGIVRAEIMLKTEAETYPQGKPFMFKCILDVDANYNFTRNITIELLKKDLTVDSETVVTTGFTYQKTFEHNDSLVMKDKGIPWQCKVVIDDMVLCSDKKALHPMYTPEELKIKLQARRDAVKVDKKSTAQYKMKKISAEDKRPPAKAIGYVVIIFLSAIALGIVACDTCKFYRNYKAGGGLASLVFKKNVVVRHRKKKTNRDSARRNSL